MGGLESARVFRSAFALASTGPRKFPVMRHQASLHWVQFNVVPNLLELSRAAHKPIKVLFLPERLADAAQQFVRPTGGRPLGPMHQLREPDMGRPKHVYVIGSEAVRSQSRSLELPAKTNSKTWRKITFASWSFYISCHLDPRKLLLSSGHQKVGQDSRPWADLQVRPRMAAASPSSPGKRAH